MLLVQLINIIIGNEGDHGIPLAFMITSWKSYEPIIVKFLEVLYITNVLTFSPKVYIINKSDTEILVINTDYNNNIFIFLCFFHYMQA